MAVCRRLDRKPKKAYASQTEAEQHVGPGENAYRCPRCDQWHVGHAKAYGRPQLEAKYQRVGKRKQRRRGEW